MQAYASRTGTRRNLEALRVAGWRLLVSAKGEHRTEGFPYALDNGAWTAYQRREPFDVAAFDRALWALGRDADWIVAPDAVADRELSLRMTALWLPSLACIAPVLVAVQDGMVDDDVRPWLSPRVGLFIGGTTAWKLRTASRWGELGRERGCHVHMARVNSARRIALADAAGCHSFDGTSATRYVVNLPKLDRARRQESIRW